MIRAGEPHETPCGMPVSIGQVGKPEGGSAMKKCALILSAIVGGIVCTLTDLIQKSEASAILLIGRTLDQLFSGIPAPNLCAIGLVLLLAVALPLIFESTSKKGAFYLGASVLALLMTMTPYKAPPGFKTEPNSVEVLLSLSTADRRPVEGALVTLWDAEGKTVISRTRLAGAQFRFFQDGGTYRLGVELPGYGSEQRTLSLSEGRPQSITITLQPSSQPLFIQRILR
jgi:hypothetical protein